MGNIDAELSKLDAYFVQDMQLNISLLDGVNKPKLDFSLHVYNLFNKMYSSNGYFYTFDDDYSVPNVVTTVEGVGYYPQAGRHFLAGLTLKF